jgi:hypothetical protein
MSNYYLGQTPETLLGNTPRFFYALRRNQNGSLFFVKNDNIKENQSIDINAPGNQEDNYNDFEVGVDFFEGINVNHEQVFDNLQYPQYRWDNRPIFYFIDDEGNLIARINQSYTYPTGISE